MISTESRRTGCPGSHYFIFVFILILSAAAQVSAIDLTLNGVNHRVVPEDVIAAHSTWGSYPDAERGLPLAALYPWMESVEYLEVQSGAHRVFWEASRLGAEKWQGAAFVEKDGVWEVRVGRDVFSAPDRIVVTGTRLDVNEVRILSTVDLPYVESKIRAILSFKDVRVTWKTIEPSVLESSLYSYRPHLVLTEISTAADSSTAGSFGRTSPVYGKVSRWYSDGVFERSASEPNDIPLPVAMDAYNPESALIYMLSTAPSVFEDGSLTTDGADALKTFLIWAGDTSASGTLLQTENPIRALAMGEVKMALSLPSSNEEKPFISASGNDILAAQPPAGLSDIVLPYFAAEPSNLNGDNKILAGLLIGEVIRLLPASAASGAGRDIMIPVDPALERFSRAYDRIGRLAVSGQLDPSEAADLIVENINNPEASAAP